MTMTPRTPGRRTLALLAVLACLGLLTPAVHAQAPKAVVRCPDGSYTNAGCAGGKALDVADPRSAEQQLQGQAAAKRDQIMADKLSAERHDREAESRKQAPLAGIGAATPTGLDTSHAKGQKAPHKLPHKKAQNKAKPSKVSDSPATQHRHRAKP